MSVEVGLDAGIVISAAVAVGVATQIVTGFGFSLVVAPVLVLVLGAHDGVRLNNMLAIVTGIAAVTVHRDHVQIASAGRLLVPALLVTPLAAWLAGQVDADPLSVVAGSLTLVAVALLASGLRLRSVHGPVGLAAAGFVSGTMNVLNGLSGPPVAMYALNAGWPPEHMRGTLALYFLVLNIAAVAALGVLSIPTGLVAGLAVAVAAGLVLGRSVAGRLDPERVRVGALVVAAVGGSAAIVRALV